KLEDHSILAGEGKPLKDNYEIIARTKKTGLTAIRLEALTDESLPHRGPGRASNGNFILTEFELLAVSMAQPAEKQKITFSSSQADYSQKDHDIARAIDGKLDDTGWAVDGDSHHENRTALFSAQQPFGYEGGTELHFSLRHEASKS